MFGAIFLMGLFHCGSFVFHSQVIFLDAFTGTSWYLVIRGGYATMALALAAFAAFVDRLYPTLAWRPATFAAVLGGLVYARINRRIFVLALPWTEDETEKVPRDQVSRVSGGQP